MSYKNIRTAQTADSRRIKENLVGLREDFVRSHLHIRFDNTPPTPPVFLGVLVSLALVPNITCASAQQWVTDNLPGAVLSESYQLVTNARSTNDPSTSDKEKLPGQPWIWFAGDKKASISISSSPKYPQPDSTSGKLLDSQYISLYGGLLGYFSEGSYEIGSSYLLPTWDITSKNAHAKAPGFENWTGVDTAPEFPKSASSRSISLTLEREVSNKNYVKVSASIFGGANFLGGSPEIGKANDNIVFIELGEGTQLYSPQIVGGRSSQQLGVTTDLNGGSEADQNRVFISGGVNGISNSSDGSFYINNKTQSLVTQRIYGGQGSTANNNLVTLNNLVLFSNMGAQNLGVRGGNGDYGGRITDNWPIEANFNTVLVSDSYIGFVNSADPVDWGKGNKFNIYGGWSTGNAKGNIVAIENSVINGNVYGGFEFQNKLDLEDGNFRFPHPNLLSIHNVKLVGKHAFYGTTTAVGELVNGVLQESSIKGVNRRTGIIYLAGENQGGSLYVRFAHFGQYLDSKGLEDNASTRDSDLLAASSTLSGISYYPLIEQVHNINSYDGASIKNLENTVRLFDYRNDETIALGQLVGKSFIQNNSGFHSSLAQRDSNQSDKTNQYHNFWVSAYTNLSSTVYGDGKNFNTKRTLFSGDKVNHYYSEAESETSDSALSLLAHDDGMMYRVSNSPVTTPSSSTNNPHNASLLHNLQYHYNGLVLYLGVSSGKNVDGKAINAVQISFTEIEKFRTQNAGQSLGALGNTFVGIFRDGGVKDQANLYFKASTADDKTSVDWRDETFDVPNFEVVQQGKHVANATYSFYKYMHFDGEEQVFKPEAYPGTSAGNLPAETFGTQSNKGVPGGVGISYWLKSVDVLPNEVLQLNGKKDNSVLATNGEPNSILQDLYTLSAQLTGSGSVLISKDSTVVLGAPNTIYTIDLNKSNGAATTNIADAIVFNPNLVEANSYTGATILEENAKLAAGKDGALGETSLLDLNAPNSAVYLQKHKQIVKDLHVGPSSLLSLSDSNMGEKEGFTDDYVADEGTLDSEKIGLTVLNEALIEGNLTGRKESSLNINNLLTLKANEDNFLGTLRLQPGSQGYFESQRPLLNASLIVTKNAQAFFGSLASDETTVTVNELVNYGQVFLTSAPQRSSSYEGSRLVMNTYTGAEGSQIEMKGVLGADNLDAAVDKVLVNDIATGFSTINFSALPGSVGQASAPIVIFRAKNNTEQTNFDLSLKNPIYVEEKANPAHMNEYLLGHSEDKKNWYLYLKPDDGSEVPTVDPDEIFSFLNPTAGTYLSTNLAQRTTHMRLYDRMGQASIIDEDGSIKRSALWLRQVGTHSHMRTEDVKTHLKTSVTQLGADIWRTHLSDQVGMIGGLYVGGLYSTSSTHNLLSAKGRSKGYVLGVYGTLFAGSSPDDSWYVDSWLQFGRYHNKISSESTTQKYKSHGFAWSLETGYKISLGTSGKGSIHQVDWTMQPQAQLIYDGIRSNNIDYDSGLVFKQIAKDNVILRLGMRFAAKTVTGGSAFVEGAWVHNTKKLGLRASLEGEQERVLQDAGRNLGELRIGLEGNVSKNVRTWAAATYRQGAKSTHEESVQIGVKYMF